MHRLKADGRSSSKSPGTSAPSLHDVGAANSTPETVCGNSHRTNSRRYFSDSARGILFALALAAGFYGSAILAGFLADHPAYILAALCIGVLVVMAGVRKEARR